MSWFIRRRRCSKISETVNTGRKVLCYELNHIYYSPSVCRGLYVEDDVPRFLKTVRLIKGYIQRRMVLVSGQFWGIFEIIISGFVVALCDLVHDCLPSLTPNSFWKSFLKYE